MKNLSLAISLVFAVLIGHFAQARPFSVGEELNYLQAQLEKLAQPAGFRLVESSIVVEASVLNYLNPIYNYSPFRLLTGPTNDRAYTVSFKISRDSQIFDGQVHFRTTEYPYCGGENNTTVRQRSTISGKLNCLSLHVSMRAEHLNDFVTIDNLLLTP